MSDRVLFLVENTSYPHDRRVRGEATALVAAGYEVTVVSPTGPKTPELQAVVEGVRVLRYPIRLSGGGAASYVREYLSALIGIRKMIRRLQDEAPFQVVVAANPPDFIIWLARPFRRRGAGLVFDLHDPAPELFETMFERRGFVHRLLVLSERRAARSADLVMTVNEPCAEIVRTRSGISDDRIFVVYNGPDPERFHAVEPKPELRRGREHLVVWIGMMSRKEGLDLLIDAADRLVKSGREDVSFAIVGAGDVRESLQAEVAFRGLSDYVSLPGFAVDDTLREYLSTASVCVSLDEHSPLNDRSLMIKVLEYMIMGKPVVQFPLAEIKRVCGDTTVYAANGDAADLAVKIGELLDDPALRAELGARARARVLDGLSWPDQIPTLLDAVGRAVVIGRGRARPSAVEVKRTAFPAEEKE